MKKALALLLTLGLVVGVVGCGNANEASDTSSQTATEADGNAAATDGGQEQSEQAAKDTLAIGLSAPPVSLNPATINDGISWSVVYGSYEALVTNKEVTRDGRTFVDRAEVEPQLATSWEENGLEYTFHLAEGVNFANGDAFTADDVVATLDLYAEQSNLMLKLINAASYEAVDEHTFKITLSEPNALLFPCLSNIYIVNTRQIEGDPSWLETHTAGTGPFVVDTWDPSSQVVLSKRADYYKETTNINKVVFRVIPESSNITLLLQNGDIDLSLAADNKDLDALAANDNLEVGSFPSNRIAFFAFNNNTAPFDNVKVRQAIASAIPTDVLVSEVMEGNALKATGTLPVGVQTSLTDGSALPYSYDLDKAKSLLEEAGYPDGFTFDFELASGYEDYASDAVVIQAELAKIGVTMNIVEVETATFLQDLIDGKAAAFIHSCTPFIPSPVYFYDIWFKSTGMMVRWSGFYNNSEVDSLLEEAKANPNTDIFTKNFEEIQKQIGEDSPWAPLYLYNTTAVYNKNLKGFRFWTDSSIHFTDLSW